MNKIFGSTDGVRGKANYFPLDTETTLRFGKTLAEYLKKHVKPNFNRPYKIIIGKDTRRSGYMLEQALTAGFLSRGVDVMTVGPVPTPAVSYLVKSFDLDLGVMITASHNPHMDNGIKVFTSNGFKLTEKQQIEIEKLYAENDFPGIDTIGRVKRIEDPSGRYIEFLKSTVKSISLEGLTVAVDCANGATYRSAPFAFRELGAKVIEMGVKPDGFNINLDCGSQFPERLKKLVLNEKADIGIALDGDGDRLILIDEKGNIIDGDYVMGLIAKYLKSKNKLPNDAIVATEYSNLALEAELKKFKIKLFKVDNGDRFVFEKMIKENLIFGGEQSGHYIFKNFSVAGDGTLSALQVLKIMKETKKPLSELAYTFKKYPQKIFNVKVSKKTPINQFSVLQGKITHWEKKFGETGRIFVRYSGTENLLRIMVESKNEKDVISAGKEISKLAEELLN